MQDEAISYDKAELRSIIRSFKGMSDEAIAQAKVVSNELATYAADEIKTASSTRLVATKVAERVAYGVRIAKSSKVGEFSYGFASQRFSGGGTTQDVLYGMEFGSNRYRQFPNRTPREGRGNAGYFIYPTLRRLQPQLVAKWEDAFSKIVKEWDKF